MRHMPKRQLPYLNRQPGRHDNGKVYYYVRVRRGPRIPIAAEYGTPEFLAAYYAAIGGKGATPVPPPTRASKGTLRWLIDNYKRSSDWVQIEPATRKQRDHFFSQMLEFSGDCAVEDITRAVVMEGREFRKATPHAANNYLKTARALFRWAKEAQHIDEDPAKDVPLIKVKTKGFPPWNMDEIHAYRRRWPLGTTQRLVLEIYINTGFRRGDAATVGWQHVQNGIIHIKAGKNKVDLYIPILPALEAALRAGPTGDMSFVTSQYGRPMTKESLGNEFRKWWNAAGVKKSAHGIRKLAATVIADNGGSEQELQALFGWTTNTMSAIYTREANRKRQSLQAAFKLLEELERNKDETVLFLPNPMGKLPNP